VRFEIGEMKVMMPFFNECFNHNCLKRAVDIGLNPAVHIHCYFAVADRMNHPDAAYLVDFVGRVGRVDLADLADLADHKHNSIL
jgi:hypothetical protein